MKVIDCDAVQGDGGQSKSLDNLLGSLKIGRGLSADAEAQETVVAAFQQVVSNKYTMLRNIPLEGLEMPVPLVLVGPAGIWALYPSRIRGVFRARGDIWEKLDDRKQTYMPAEENLITRTEQMAQAVHNYLVSHGVVNPQVEPVLVFTNPGVHIETVRSIVRVVLIDALNRFVSRITQSRLIYDQEQVEMIVGVLTLPSEELSRQADSASTAQARAQEKLEAANANLERFDTAFSKVEKLPFSSRQWVLLGGLILVNIIILVAFVVFILYSN